MTDDLGGLSARIGLNTAPLRVGRLAAEKDLVAVEGSLLRVEKASVRMSTAFGKTGKIIGAVVGFELIRKAAEGIKGSIEYAIDLEATMRRVKGVFGEASEQVLKFSDGADKTLGQTKEQALQTAVRFGTLATQFGATQDQAAGMSETLVKLGNDLAHSKGTSVESATGALATGLVGRGRALRLYGVDLSAATVKQEALKEGLIATVQQGLTPAQTFQASYNLILAQTTKQQGYFGKNLDTTKEKLEVARATLRDASEELGVAFAPAAKAAADVLAKDVAPALKTIGEGFAFLADHKTAAHLIEVAGAAGLLAVGVAKIGKAVKETRAFYAETFGGHAANTKAIRAEGAAAQVAAGQLTELAAAERVSGGAAASSATLRSGATIAGSGFGGGLTQAEILALQGGAGGGSKLLKAGKFLGLAGAGVIGGQFAGDALKGSGHKTGGTFAQDTLTGLGVGAAVGSVVPVIGTAVGAGVGAAIGASTAAVQTGGSVDDLIGPLLVKQVTAVVASGKKFTPPEAAAIVQGAPKKYRQAVSAAIGKAINLDGYHVGRVGLAAAGLGGARHQFNVDRQLAADPNAQAADAGLVSASLGGAFDALPTTATGDPAKAATAVKNAQDRVASATDRLSLARERLNVLQKNGKTTALQLASATDSVANAQRSLERAQSGLHGSKAAQAAASGTTALDFATVSTRLGAQLSHTRGLTNAARTLIRDGVSRPVLIELEKLEKDAPGTLAKLAGSMTKAQAASLNANEAALEKAWAAFLATPREAAIAADKRKVAQEATAYAAAVRRAYATALQNDGLPVPGSGSVGQGVSERGPGHNVASVSPVTNISMPNAVIVASDPAALAAELRRKKRVDALAGRP